VRPKLKDMENLTKICELLCCPRL